MIEREIFQNGLCLLTESMPDVRSVSIGAWLNRGSRHENPDHLGIAHFVEHMLFKGTTKRTAEDIAQEIDSLGGHLDAFTAKECASYYVKVLDEHLPRAVDILSDLLLHPTFDADDIEKEKKVVIEEIKMVEDTPDDLLYELFTASFWPDHALGRPILGTVDSVSRFDAASLRDYFESAYAAENFVVFFLSLPSNPSPIFKTTLINLGTICLFLIENFFCKSSIIFLLYSSFNLGIIFIYLLFHQFFLNFLNLTYE